MKPLINAAVAVIAVAAVAGCGTAASAPETTASTPGTAASVPVPTGADLKGTWIQAGAGYAKGAPVTWENQTVVIEKADGQGFAGFKEYKNEGEPPQKENVDGVIGLDGNILIVDDDGTFQGRLIDGKMQGQYAEVGNDSVAMNLEISRK